MNELLYSIDSIQVLLREAVDLMAAVDARIGIPGLPGNVGFAGERGAHTGFQGCIASAALSSTGGGMKRLAYDLSFLFQLIEVRVRFGDAGTGIVVLDTEVI